MLIRLITLGKLKETYWQQAEQEYLKRLSPFTKLEIVELKEEDLAANSPENIRKHEAKKILKYINKDDLIIALDSHGKSYTSEEFSQTLTHWTAQGQTLTFIIGGPLGLDEEVLTRANAKLSFSKMTFTHQMVRIFLLEQLYRAYMIASKRKYHY